MADTDALTVFLAELDEAAGADRRLDAHLARLRAELDPLRSAGEPGALEERARSVTEAMALALQGSLLVRHAPHAVADAFCASRLGGEGGLEYGTLPSGCDVSAILARSGI